MGAREHIRAALLNDIPGINNLIKSHGLHLTLQQRFGLYDINYLM